MTATKPAFLVNLLTVLLMPASSVQAAPGELDLSLNPTFDGTVAAIVLQPDGRVLVGGYFTIANEASRNGIARLNSDGTLDSSFVEFGPWEYPGRPRAMQPDDRMAPSYRSGARAVTI